MYCLLNSLNEAVKEYFMGTSNFKECHPRCVGKQDSWKGSQKHNSYDI